MEGLKRGLRQAVKELTAAGVGAAVGGTRGAVSGLAHSVIDEVAKAGEEAELERMEKEHGAKVMKRALEIKKQNPKKPARECIKQAEEELRPRILDKHGGYIPPEY